MGKRITVALDAMGGDYAPLETVKGAVDAVKELDVNIKLVGPAEQLHAELAKYQYDKERIEIVHASEVIGTDESPTMAIRRKKDSSLVVALNLVKNGEADAIVSAGSTGALLTGALLIGRALARRRASCSGNLPSDKNRLYLPAGQRRKCGLQAQIFGAVCKDGLCLCGKCFRYQKSEGGVGEYRCGKGKGQRTDKGNLRASGTDGHHQFYREH